MIVFYKDIEKGFVWKFSICFANGQMVKNNNGLAIHVQVFLENNDGDKFESELNFGIRNTE